MLFINVYQVIFDQKPRGDTNRKTAENVRSSTDTDPNECTNPETRTFTNIQLICGFCLTSYYFEILRVRPGQKQTSEKC